MDEWVQSHIVQVPQETVKFCGDLMRGARMLNVGCGDMLSDLGLLSCGPKYIEGLDIDPRASDWLTHVVNRARFHGFDLPADHADRIRYTQYDGTIFPFEDEAFDFAFSWSAFEHVSDLDAVLREMHRVLTPEGAAFVQVYPWFRSRHGSHLTEWLKRPFFHLTETARWVKTRMIEQTTVGAIEKSYSKYMVKEYVDLNRRSPNEFYEAARNAGFVIAKARAIVFDEDLSVAPRGVSFSDLMISGTMMLMRKGGDRTASGRDRQL